jgi:DNA mismatch repair ATPase MutS
MKPFGQDAVDCFAGLGITLTKRNNGAAASSDLRGFPHHALDTYLHKLVKPVIVLLFVINWKIQSLQKGSLKEV